MRNLFQLAASSCMIIMLFSTLAVSGMPVQQITEVKGRVTDAAGTALPGVSVTVKDYANIGTSTDQNGNYILEIPEAEDAVLVFTLLGFEVQEVPVNGRTAIDATLQEGSSELDEIVVVGYGTQRKRDLTGAVSSVSAEQLRAVVASNAAAAMQGRVPGLVVTNNNYRPGAGATVRIRGNRSITATNDPLYVIDGNPISRQGITLNDINPSDIASIEVLKDASATAIYGSRGANGVILITTKRGREGKTTISYNGYEGYQEPLRTLDIMDAGEYAEYVRESYRNNVGGTVYESPVPNREEDQQLEQFAQDPYVLESVLTGYDENGNYDPARVRGFDWMDAVMQRGHIRDHQLSVSGGTGQTQVLFSAGYFSNKGLIRNLDYDRYNIRANLDHAIGERFKISTSSVITRANDKASGDFATNLYSLARSVNPLASPYDPEGNLMLNPGNDPLTLNPLLDIDGVVGESRKDRILTNINFEAEILEGLQYRANFGYDYRTARDGEFEASMSTPRAGRDDWASYLENSSTDILLENILFYDHTFSGKHQLNVTLMQSMQTHRFENHFTEAQGIPYPHQKFYNIGSASEVLNVGSQLEEWQMLSWMGRINYSFAGKYLFTFTGRSDGSSVLAPGNKWEFFPSGAFAWRMIEEDFLQNAGFLDELKLRVSYGKTGNSSVGPYQTQGNLGLIRYVWDEDVIIGFAPGSMPNPDLSWETTAQADVGLDFGLFNHRISGTIELYRSRTTGLLMPRNLPVVSGFEGVLENSEARTRNQGLELALSTVNLDTRSGLQWTTDIVFSANKEEIAALPGGVAEDLGNTRFVGHPITGIHFNQRMTGIWQDTEEDRAEMEKFNANGHTFEPGTIRLEDVNGDYRIDAQDRLILGNNRPEWTGSFTSEMSFKQFDFSFQFYASYGAMGYFDKALQLNGRYNMVDVNYWTPDNPSNEYPKPSVAWLAPDYINRAYYQDVSFLRLQYVTLGYSFPETIRTRAGMSRLRIYVSAQNAWIHTKFDGLDPEGERGFNSPSPRTFLLGLNVSF